MGRSKKETVDKILDETGIKNEDQNTEDMLAGCLSMVTTFFLHALILMLLWNFLMPAIFGITAIGFWQACGLKFMSASLFGTVFSRT